MLRAYMDDSGSHEGSHNCVIGGYWGSVNEWRRFERAWNKVLDSERIEEFHAKDFWQRIPGLGRVGPYKGWSDTQHANFIDQLLRVIADHKITPFACGVLVSEWNALPVFRRIAMSHEKHQKPVLLPLSRILLQVASYCHRGKVMHFTFDDDPQNYELGLAMARRLALLKEEMKTTDPFLYEKMGDFGFADSKRSPPIQAADLIAYEAHRFAKGEKQGKPMRIEYKRALVRFRSRADFWMFDEPRMASLAKLFDQVDEEIGGIDE